VAILAAIATAHTSSELHHPTLAIHTTQQALVSGFKLAFDVAASFAFFGALVAAVGMPSIRRAAVRQAQPAPAIEA
jgi:hypothetical protein